jgi:uncharacterized membrane protein YfcA
LLWTMVLIGFVTGILTGLMSVGGGLTLIFLLLFIPPFFGLEYTMHTIAGMVIIQTIFSASSGLISYWKNRLIDSFLMRYMGASSFLGGALGAVFAGALSNQILVAVFAALSLVSAASMFIKPIAPETLPFYNKPLAILIGLGIGILGGMFGLGAGFLYLPIMLNVFKIQPKPAIGTGLFLAIALVLGALVIKAPGSSYPWVEGLILAFGAIPGAQIGSYLGRTMNSKSLRYIMAVAIILISIKIWRDMLLGYGVSALSFWIGFVVIGLILFSTVVLIKSYLKSGPLTAFFNSSRSFVKKKFKEKHSLGD